MKKITITIHDGNATVETEGFSGQACLRETEALKRALGTIKKQVAKQEMSKPELQKEANRG